MFCSGSPIPMKTMLYSPAAVPVSASSAATWPTISPAARLRVKPSFAVMQKAQPKPQPTCEEMQKVIRSSAGIATASTCPPCGSSSTYFVVPSDAACREAIRGASAA